MKNIKIYLISILRVERLLLSHWQLMQKSPSYMFAGFLDAPLNPCSYQIVADVQRK